MSNTIIIRDIIPIVMRLMNKQGANLNSETQIRDENLITFLEEELMQHFSICGSADDCKNLELAIAETKKLDFEAFVEYIKFLLNKYINLQIKLQTAQKLDPQKITVKQVVEMFTDGKTENVNPPDRFTEFRKKNQYGPERWIKKGDKK